MSLDMPVLVKGNISKNFVIRELANMEASENIKLVLTKDVMIHLQMMQELRDMYGRPLNVSSWYRTQTFNRKVGGHPRSEHLIGCATDITGLDKRDYGRLTDYWRKICEKYGRVGNLGYYTWGIHFGSKGNRFGYITFHVFDNRKIGGR